MLLLPVMGGEKRTPCLENRQAPGSEDELYPAPEPLWQEWGLILNMNSPSYHPVGASLLSDMEYLLTAVPVPTVLLGFLKKLTWVLQE